jgi:Ca-activated chloride channel family protein
MRKLCATGKLSLLTTDFVFHKPIWAFAFAAMLSPLVRAEDLTHDYNLGVQQYQQSQFDQAAAAFRRASTSGDDRLAAMARYNLGNCLYATATELIRQSNQANLGDAGQPSEAPSPVQVLQNAVNAYRSALRLNPNDEDARFNLENATRLMDQLNHQKPQGDDQQEKVQQDQDQQEKDQQDQDQQDQDQDQQDQEKDQSQQQQAEQPQPNQDSDQQDQKQPSQSDPNGDPNQPEESSQEQDQQQESGQDSEQQTSEDEGSEDQNDESQPPRQSDPGSDTESGQPTDKELTEQEAQKMLQAVRDRDLQRRRLLEARKRSRRVVVPRDW